MKSNKSFLKRLRVTRKGRLVSRTPGQNHFNAKRSGASTMRHKRAGSTQMTQQDRSRFLP